MADERTKRLKRKRRQAKRQAKRQGRKKHPVLKVLGIVLVMALLFALAFAVGDGEYHATVIGWLPFLTALFALVAARVYLAVLKRSLHFADDAEAKECERGRDVRLEAHFENSSPLFFFKIIAYFYVSDLYGNVASEAPATMALSPFDKQDFGFTSTFDHIGTFTAGLDRVEITDFLGLFTATIKNEARRTVDVLPQIQPINAMRFSNDAIVESNKAARSVLADSMDYAYVRDYELGDPLKSIHWKLSARAGHYMTRLYEIQTTPGVVVIIDTYAPCDDAEELMGMFDAVVESAFSIAEYSRMQGMDVELLFYDQEGERQRIDSWTSEDRVRIIQSLPRMVNDEALEAQSIEMLRDEIVSPTGQGNVVMCSASMDPVMLSTLAEAKIRRRAPLLVSVIPRDVIERERDAYCKPLARLDASDVPYLVLSDSKELLGVSA